MRTCRLILCGALLVCSVVSGVGVAATIQVTVVGTVEYNQINSGPLSSVAPGQSVQLTFEVDSATFVDDPMFPTRGYAIDPATFVLALGSVVASLQSPFPAGQTPYFVVRDNDPAVDGFLLSTSTASPNGVPLGFNGAFGSFACNFYVTYGGTTLSSLNIENATGTYDFTGLSVFNFTVDDGPFQPLGLLFATMEIAAPTSAPEFIRGDANGDASFNIADAVKVLGFLFGMEPVGCLDALDANDDGATNIADAVYALAAQFSGGAPPPAPFGTFGVLVCGPDSTADDPNPPVSGDLGCATPGVCP